MDGARQVGAELQQQLDHLENSERCPTKYVLKTNQHLDHKFRKRNLVLQVLELVSGIMNCLSDQGIMV